MAPGENTSKPHAYITFTPTPDSDLRLPATHAAMMECCTSQRKVCGYEFEGQQMRVEAPGSATARIVDAYRRAQRKDADLLPIAEIRVVNSRGGERVYTPDSLIGKLQVSHGVPVEETRRWSSFVVNSGTQEH